MTPTVLLSKIEDLTILSDQACRAIEERRTERDVRARLQLDDDIAYLTGRIDELRRELHAAIDAI